MTRASRPLRPLLLVAVCLLTGACAAALQLAAPAPPRMFELSPKSTFDEDLPKVQARLSVEVPSATAGLNTARIALRPTPTTLEYYASASWVEVVPVMLQNLLLESLDNTGAIDVLGREVVGVRADYGLITHVREFQAEYQGRSNPPRIHVRIQARLVRLPRRASIADTSVEYVIPANGTSLDAIVGAFDEAFGKTARRLVEWTLKEAAGAAKVRR